MGSPHKDEKAMAAWKRRQERIDAAVTNYRIRGILEGEARHRANADEAMISAIASEVHARLQEDAPTPPEAKP